jgi:tetratricopeptide (TPR) repeat protein
MYTTPQPFSRITAKLIAATFFGAVLFAHPIAVNAAGGGSPAPASGAACSSKTTQNSCLSLNYCWWKSSNNTCKKKKNQSELNQNQRLYAEGRLLAKTGSYAKAIAVLKTADQSDPHVLNYLGYSYRKSGDLPTAINYYKTALAIDPNFVLAREYLGEGYVKAGRLDLAKLELEQIGKRCGKGCKEYVELAAVITGTDKATW